ncbi:hypothetical protein [Chryseobacterium mucoviscidosis]|uniref:hypothetical protein n=1 Tax=Chryseobacterium mucoviscidosis TaxID=1945581 RepID=UPI003015A6F2
MQNVSVVYWEFDPNTTLTGGDYFAGSTLGAANFSNQMSLWQDAAGGGGSGMLFFTNSQGISGFSATGFLAGIFFKQLMSGTSIISMLGGFNVLRNQLIDAGWDKPEKTKAAFGDYVDLITKVPVLYDLYDLTEAKFKYVNKKIIDGHVPPFSKNVEIGMNNIDNILEYAYVIGHELNHVVDNIYNWKPFLKIVPHTGQTANVFTILSEYRSYSWEKKLGNDIDVFKKIEYTKKNFPAAYSIFEKYFNQFKNNQNFVTP